MKKGKGQEKFKAERVREKPPGSPRTRFEQTPVMLDCNSTSGRRNLRGGWG